MKFIDGYTKYWSLRNWVFTLVVEAIFTGLCVGMMVSATAHDVAGHDVVFVRTLFLLAFVSGVGTLQSTLIVLHNCSPAVKTGKGEANPPLGD